MNMIEKILARGSGKKEVRAGDVVVAKVDLMVMHDLSSNFVMKVFENEMQDGAMADPSRIAFVFDHNFAPATLEAAEALAAVRRFARKYGIRNVLECGSGSVHHAILEAGLWAPGQIIIGCDSHTPVYGAFGAFATGVGNNSMAALGFAHGLGWFRVPETIQVVFHGQTQPGVTARDISQYLVGYLGEDGAIYKALEYAGPYIESLSVEDRLLFPLQSIDVGAKCGFINPDDKTAAFISDSATAPGGVLFHNDANAAYVKTMDIDVSKFGPQIACPPTVGNVKPVEEALGVEINVAETGGSTGGRLCDIREITRVFRNRKVAPGVRLQIVPATRGILKTALKEGLIETLVEAGANIFPPSAGSNQMYNMGALAEDEVMISTQARNFPARNGHPKARHYLASSLTVAVSAWKGRIADPREVL